MSETSADRPSARLAAVGRIRRSPLRDFLHGAALIFDSRGNLGQRGISTVRCPSDRDRIAEDWWAVGNDMRRAMGQPPVQRPAP